MSFVNRISTICIIIAVAILTTFPVSAQTQDCVKVAQLFEKTICLSEITVEEKHVESIKAQFEQQGLDSENALKSKSLENLKDIIWMAALKHKFGIAALTPTEEEINLYSEAFKNSLERSHKENKENSAKIKKLLANNEYDPGDEIKLRNLLTSIETSMAFYKERERYNADMPPEFHSMVIKAQRDIAKTMIQDWKINQLLYHEYGGGIAFQQGGLEPVDAYGKFINYIYNKGGLVINDSAYHDVFKIMELYIATPQNIISKDDTEIYTNYFSTPHWQFQMDKNTEFRP